MDKNGKLQRYDRKDYTEVVDFPVEIVGRDGVVRRYGFEDSIRLYQRRITFAPVRYRDTDLVRAESNHCQARIDQLRRSYFHRFGWGTPEGQPAAEEVFGALCGELAAFIRRVLRAEGRPEIRFDALETERDGTSTWFVTPENARSGMILYVHRFPAPAEPSPVGADAVRDRFFASLKALERAGRAGGDCERLLAFHHTVDCGFVLTGRGGDFSSFVSSSADAHEPTMVDIAPTPWDEVLEITRKGDYDAALARCRQLVKDQPYHRNAYVAAAMLANFLGDPLGADEVASIGVRYFPGDGSLLYYLGLARMRLGQFDAAERCLQDAIAAAPDMVAARTVLAVRWLTTGRHSDAAAILSLPDGVEPDDRRAAAEASRLRQWVMWRRMMLGWAGVLLVAATAVSLMFGWVGAIVGAAGVAILAVGWFAFQRQLDAVASRQHFEEIGQGLRRIHRAERRGAPIS